MNTDTPGYSEAHKAILANVSPRYLKLDELDHWVDGTQYAGKPHWFADTETPLWDRAPCIVYPVVQIARDSNGDMLFGEGRSPVFSTKPGEDESGDDAAPDDSGLDEADSEVVDRAIREYHKACTFTSHSRDALGAGQGCGTAIAIHGVRNGKPTAELIPAKWAEPTFGVNGEVASVEIRYPFLEQYKDTQDKRWKVRAKLFRRVIDSESDTTYKPADAKADGDEPAWSVDVSVKHGLGFCPVVWYPFMRGCVPVSEIDGHAIHRLLFDAILAHDIARSQWHRGALMSEPQMYVTGVEQGYNPTGTGRLPEVRSTQSGGAASLDNPVNGAFRSPGRLDQGAIKKGPGHLWKFENEATKVGAIVYPGDALKAQQDNCSDLRIKLQEALCVVFLDPENIKFASTTSGKALEAIKQKQLDRCAQYRDDIRDHFLLPSIDMQLRIMAKIGDGLRVNGVRKALPILTRFRNDAGEWNGPSVSVKWGDWFKPDPAEQGAIVTMIVAALTVGIITKRIALEKIAPIFGIENVNAALEELEAKDAEDKAHEADLAHAAGNLLNGAPPGNGGPAGQDAPPSARAGSGAAAGVPQKPAGGARAKGGAGVAPARGGARSAAAG